MKKMTNGFEQPKNSKEPQEITLKVYEEDLERNLVLLKKVKNELADVLTMLCADEDKESPDIRESIKQHLAECRLDVNEVLGYFDVSRRE